MSRRDNNLQVHSSGAQERLSRITGAATAVRRALTIRYLALAVLESSGLSGWLFTRGKCCSKNEKCEPAQEAVWTILCPV